MKQAKVFFQENFAGVLTEDENGYTFVYNVDYLQRKDTKAINLMLPLSEKPYNSQVLFPFFDGLIPELHLVTERNEERGYAFKNV